MKTALIIKREYLLRVKKRSFIITTLLFPLLLLGFGVLIGYVSAKGASEKKIAILDKSGFFSDKLKSTKSVKFVFPQKDSASLKAAVNNGEYDAFLYIPAISMDNKENLSLFSNEQMGMEVETELQDQMNDAIKAERIKSAGIDTAKLNAASKSTILLQTKVGKEEKSSSSAIAMGVGYFCGILLYIFMLLYGLGVMRSVMEEKTSRIAEIIISSVRPFQLMMGKIIGVALVGLTQVVIWVVFILLLSMIFGPMLASMGGGMANAGAASAGAPMPSDPELLNTIKSLTGGVNWLGIALWFMFYFLGGYFLYASLFAAVGSLVNEDQQDAQQFTSMITMPIILAFVLMTSALRDPNGSIAVFGSLFPLTSPIVMMARIPFGVPVWQLLLSAGLLILGFILTTMLAAKIYRTGILMYGKKITFKEVGKWIMRKG